MAFDGYLKIEGIPGECDDAAHKNWIRIDSYAHKIQQKATRSVGTTRGSTTGRADHGAFKVKKFIDKASPKINLSCSKGSRIDEIILELCRAAEGNQPYMKYILMNVIVSSVEYGGASQDDIALPLEELCLSYEKIDWIYTEVDDKGKKKGDIKSFFNVKGNFGG